ncbi:3-deoxy-7-phosphoheptulonate synthase [Sphaerochaeta sp. PS]|uniref:3-deoxy-7-phosphoheptulonate synthase n=1 Tax=Sphaerochaeta sp. PS TaxID=3076336 RepID=UPI0028A533BA|nr:3-deoxy-7-phosphoheptulonate synthase [Sphaerochaeta sp. PS]MDT4762823.1 3-deoxy-7-phosphoheptulonate synthase [Sphaerochaeta sp. PS]
MANVDIRIKKTEPLATPAELAKKFPVDEKTAQFISQSRQTVNDIILGRDHRLLAIVGPCSLHDRKAALEYALKLKQLAKDVSGEMYIVMRAYFEKPRTVLGWKGLILDPWMDGSYAIEEGISQARSLLLDIVSLGVPVGCEVLDPIIPQYIDELMSWSSIGARTTESQIHRNLASGLSVAVGFKNSTSGDLLNAINAIKCAYNPASFIGMDAFGASTIFRTTGNECCHLILRGGDQSPNYYEDDVELARNLMVSNELNPAIMIDCSHSNSRKHYDRQKRVLRSIVDQVSWGDTSIRGFMLESNLFSGAQKIPDDLSQLKYGVSVTDACIGWDETERILVHACELIRKARLEEGNALPL